MQYYFDGDDNLYDHAREKTFFIPAKTKQIGSIEPYVKIYMEDYVYTYLYQYARSGGNTEKLAALIGRHSVVDGQEVIVISGAVQGKGSTQVNGVECFTEDTWEYIGGQMQKYFEGMSVVGWVHCQPGFGSFLMSRDESFHKEYFKEKWQVLFVLDSIDKLDAFYIYHPERKHLQPARGYFIYYDKNKEMQEYMLENSLIRPRETAAELQKEEQKRTEEQTEQTTGRRRRKPSQAERLDAAKEIRRVLQRREKVAKQAKKEHYATLAAVSAVLCVVCICMGFAMMSSLNRLRTLETELVAMQTSYEALAEGFEDVRVQSVFAVQQAEQVEQAMQEEQKKLIAQAEAAEKAKKAEREEKKTEKAQKTYCVESGDSLGYISTKFYGTSSGIKKIMEANSLQNADMIFEGQTLLIP